LAEHTGGPDGGLEAWHCGSAPEFVCLMLPCLEDFAHRPPMCGPGCQPGWASVARRANLHRFRVSQRNMITAPTNRGPLTGRGAWEGKDAPALTALEQSRGTVLPEHWQDCASCAGLVCCQPLAVAAQSPHGHDRRARSGAGNGGTERAGEPLIRAWSDKGEAKRPIEVEDNGGVDVYFPEYVADDKPVTFPMERLVPQDGKIALPLDSVPVLVVDELGNV